MFISKYVKKIPFSENQVLLYNLFNSAMYLILAEKLNEIEVQISKGNSIELLEDYNNLVEQEIIVEKENIPVLRKEADYFLVTIEMTNCCNLKCLYCYENDKNTRMSISNETIEKILKYIENVFITDTAKKTFVLDS